MQAVTFGCNTYGHGDGTPGISAAQSLPGAVASARGMHILLSRRGFLVNGLYDSAATKHNLGNAISSMFSAARPGEQLFLHVVGHGTLQDILFPDGSIHHTPCLVPADALPSDGSFHPENLVTPWEWQHKLAQLPAGVRLTVILDICFAGGLLQAPAVSTRYRSQYLRQRRGSIRAHHLTPFAPGVPRAGMSFVAEVAAAGLIELVPCGAGEESVEMPFGPKGLWYAIFSYWVLRFMQSPAAKGWSNQDYFDHVKQEVSRVWIATPAVYGSTAARRARFLV